MYNSEIKFIIFNIMANNQFILFKIKYLFILKTIKIKCKLILFKYYVSSFISGDNLI